MGQVLIPDDLVVAGTISASAMNIPANAVGDDAVVALAGVKASKLVHDLRPSYVQANGTAATSVTQFLHLPVAAGTISAFSVAIMTAAVGGATVTVDLQYWNGSSWVSNLSAVITINSSTAIDTLVAGTVTTTAYTAGQPLRIVVTATASGGTLPQGLIVRAQLFEKSQ